MILVFLEQVNGKLPKSSLSAVSAALEAKNQHGYSKAVGLVVGSEVSVAVGQAKKTGLDEVLFVSDVGLVNYLAVSYEEVVASVAREVGAKLLVAAATTTGKDLMPRVAANLEASQASDVLALLQGGTFKRPMYAGNVIAEVELTTEVKVITIRPTAFEPVELGALECSERQVSLVVVSSNAQEFDKFETVASERPELTDAEVVVTGGRALKSAENFSSVLSPLADVLNAAIGASRAAVDSGYAPNDWQVGQTGKVVAPNLYIAVGVSGAIQHLAGMKDSKVIVAINTDPEAPIFEVADYGLVADLFKAVPELTEALKNKS